MILRALLSLFRPRYVVEHGATPWGPGLDVKRKVFGLRLRVGDDIFAKVASAYIDSVPGWRSEPAAGSPPPTPLRPSLAGGGLAGAPASPRPAALPSPRPLYRSVSAPPRVAPEARRPPARPAAAPPLPPALLAASPSPVAPPAAPPTPRAAPASPEHAPAASAGWRARLAAMAQPATWAETAEIQAAAHVYGVTLRVWADAGRGGPLQANFVANPNAAGETLDLVLEHGHFRWVRGGVVGDALARGDAAYARLENVPADGNCFFHCLAAGLASGPRHHLDARREVVAFLADREDMQVDGADPGVTLRHATS